MNGKNRHILKSVLCLAALLCAGPLSGAGKESSDSLLIVFWNLENLFDCDGENGGPEWTPEGSRHWTPGRLRNKCNGIGKTLLWIGEQYRQLPDLIAVAEIENEAVLRRLVHSSVLRKLEYGFVHFESPDKRGIDVALLYRKARFFPDKKGRPDAEAIRIPGRKTRDILRCRLPLPGISRDGAPDASDSLTILVNHHPSKLGGPQRSGPRREAAMRVLREACLQSSADSSARAFTVATGDFNDTPDGAAFRMLEDVMVNLSAPLHQKGEGSLKYDGAWELIDQFWVSPDLAGSHNCETAVIYAPFLLTKDSAHEGLKPLRTYSGPHYLGGLSDHLPIVLKIRYSSCR